jgi:hypothetical protein
VWFTCSMVELLLVLALLGRGHGHAPAVLHPDVATVTVCQGSACWQSDPAELTVVSTGGDGSQLVQDAGGVRGITRQLHRAG